MATASSAMIAYILLWWIAALPFTPLESGTQTWCATPRRPEPLVIDAGNLLRSTDTLWTHRRTIVQPAVAATDSVEIIHDEGICRRAAAEYWSILRRAVPDLFGSRADSAVLVVRVGTVYLVDDLRTRAGPGAYWEVMLFDRAWTRRYGYGAGS